MHLPPRRAARRGSRRRFTILSSCPERWGGSEELWWQAAVALRAEGHRVDVFKTNLALAHPRIRALRDLGCAVHELAGRYRTTAVANAVLPEHWALVPERRQMLALAAVFARRGRPHLAIISQGQNYDAHHLAIACRWLGVPYVMVSQKATEQHWPADWARPHAARVFRSACRVAFVSEHNRRLTEEQIGEPIGGAVVLRNPVLVGRDGPYPWPADDGVLRLACVARLYAAEKGQDVLLRTLAQQRWRARPVRVSFYGEGPNRDALAGMARHLGLDSVVFAGQTDRVDDVWRTHHALVLPSRAEGLPLALVEAMMCGRVPIVTDVGGSAEVVHEPATGFVAAAPTVAALDGALERAFQARADWPAIGAAAARSIREDVPEDAGAPLAALALAEAGRAA